MIVRGAHMVVEISRRFVPFPAGNFHRAAGQCKLERFPPPKSKGSVGNLISREGQGGEGYRETPFLHDSFFGHLTEEEDAVLAIRPEYKSSRFPDRRPEHFIFVLSMETLSFLLSRRTHAL